MNETVNEYKNKKIKNFKTKHIISKTWEKCWATH